MTEVIGLKNVKAVSKVNIIVNISKIALFESLRSWIIAPHDTYLSKSEKNRAYLIFDL